MKRPLKQSQAPLWEQKYNTSRKNKKVARMRSSERHIYSCLWVESKALHAQRNSEKVIIMIIIISCGVKRSHPSLEDLVIAHRLHATHKPRHAQERRRLLRGRTSTPATVAAKQLSACNALC